MTEQPIISGTMQAGEDNIEALKELSEQIRRDMLRYVRRLDVEEEVYDD